MRPTLLLIFLAASYRARGLSSLSDPAPTCSRFFTPTPRRAKDMSVSSSTCHLADRANIPIPEPNHRVCYRTCVRTYPNGTEVCETLSRAEVITEPLLLTQPTDPTLQGMYFTTRLASPGFFARKQYTNNTICRYHVQCDPGQLLHFLISSLSIEEPYDITCLDSLTIDRSLYGAKKTICGKLSSIKSSDRADFNDGRLYVEFSTNRVISDDGFYIAVTCVRPQFYNFAQRPGFEPGDEEAQRRDRRETRNAIEDHTTSSAIFRVRHKRGFRVVTIVIQSGSSLLYHQNTVRVYRSNQWLYRLPSIEVLQVYNKVEGYLAFYGSAETRSFPGLAEMMIGSGVVHLIQKGVDPKFQLKISDEDALELLYHELYRQRVFLNEDFNIAPDEEDFSTRPVNQSSKQMMPTVTSPVATNATPSPTKNIDIKELALIHSISENGVVRAAACLYLDKVLNRTCVL